jgi:hypothetical protein
MSDDVNLRPLNVEQRPEAVFTSCHKSAWFAAVSVHGR